MEETTTHEYLMWMKRKQILMSHIQPPIFETCNNNSWEERVFAEDAARILGGCMWPPRSYSCHFCKREFRSAQALGGHMNVHRRDRARLKQNLSKPLQNSYHHKDHNFTASGHLTSRPSTISPQENSCKGCPDSEPKEKVNAKEEFLKGLGIHDYVETTLSVGQNTVFSKKVVTDSCGDLEEISYKRPKISIPVIRGLKPCSNSNDRGLTFQSAEFVLGLKPGMEDLDLELRLGIPQKV